MLIGRELRMVPKQRALVQVWTTADSCDLNFLTAMIYTFGLIDSYDLSLSSTAISGVEQLLLPPSCFLFHHPSRTKTARFLIDQTLQKVTTVAPIVMQSKGFQHSD